MECLRRAVVSGRLAALVAATRRFDPATRVADRPGRPGPRNGPTEATHELRSDADVGLVVHVPELRAGWSVDPVPATERRTQQPDLGPLVRAGHRREADPRPTQRRMGRLLAGRQVARLSLTRQRNNPAIHPGAVDIPDNGIDEDCNGVDAVNNDRDGDGSPRPQDCNDTNPSIHPGAREVIGNTVDENCDGVIEPYPPLVGSVAGTWSRAGSRTRNVTLVAHGFPFRTVITLRSPARRSARAARSRATWAAPGVPSTCISSSPGAPSRSARGSRCASRAEPASAANCATRWARPGCPRSSSSAGRPAGRPGPADPGDTERETSVRLVSRPARQGRYGRPVGGPLHQLPASLLRRATPSTPPAAHAPTRRRSS